MVAFRPLLTLLLVTSFWHGSAYSVEDQGAFCDRLWNLVEPEFRNMQGTEVAVIVPDVYIFKFGPDELRDGAGEVDMLPALRNPLDTVCACFTDKTLPLIARIRTEAKGNPTLKITVLERAVVVTTGDHLERFAPIVAFFAKNYGQTK